MTALMDRATSWRPPRWARPILLAVVLVLVLAVTVTLTGQTQLTSSGTSEAAVRLARGG